MLDSDLAQLYGVETKALKRAVKRNAARFPEDFCFPLHQQEVANLRCHFGTSSSTAWGGSRYASIAFTEQGVAMLSGVLKSKRAIQVNVAIMRAFVKLREALLANVQLASKLAELEHTIANHDEHIQALFDVVRQLMTPPDPTPRKIGFGVREGRVSYGRRPIQRR